MPWLLTTLSNKVLKLYNCISGSELAFLDASVLYLNAIYMKTEGGKISTVSNDNAVHFSENLPYICLLTGNS